MPRRRPRVRRSTASSTDWEANAPATPTDDFTIKYQDDDVGYAVDLGLADPVPLRDLLFGDAQVTGRGWAGLAQPDEIDVELNDGATAPPTPGDFTCRYRHSHRRWTRINDDGQPAGNSNDSHDHVFGLPEFVSADYTEPDDPNPRFHWYVPHLHPVEGD